MKHSNKKIFWYLIPVGIIVLFDEWIKRKALSGLPDEASIVDPDIISFAIHKNWGIAFDIPFKMEIIILISLIMGIALTRIAIKNFFSQPKISFASLMIIIGAMGNLSDRLVYGFTVDYIILFGRSAVNFSDAVIVFGVIYLLLASRKSRRNKILKDKIDKDEKID